MIPGLLLVEVVAGLQVDAPRIQALHLSRLGKPRVWRACNLPKSITIIKCKASHHSGCRRQHRSCQEHHLCRQAMCELIGLVGVLDIL